MNNSGIFNKNDFEIILNNRNYNNKISDLISWETNNFNQNIKIINFTNNILDIKIKNKFNCEIDFEKLTYNCNNNDLENLIQKSMNENIILFLDNLLLLLDNNDIEIEDNTFNWNPYDYLNTKIKDNYDLNYLKDIAYNNLKENYSNLNISIEHTIDVVFNEIKILANSDYELIFQNKNMFNFDVKLKNFNNIDDILINIDLTSYNYPYFPPLLAFYDTFNDNFENKLLNLSYLHFDQWNSVNNLLIILNNFHEIINKNVTEVEKTIDDFRNLNLIICKLLSVKKIKLYLSKDLISNIELSSDNKKWTFNKDKLKNKNLYELSLFEQLLEEIKKTKNNNNFNDFIENSKLFDIIEFYFKKYEIMDMKSDMFYDIFYVIFSIIEITNYKIKNLSKLNNLKNQIFIHNDNQNELLNRILNYKHPSIQNKLDDDIYINMMKQFAVMKVNFKNYYFDHHSTTSNINQHCITKITKELLDYKVLPNISTYSSIFISYNELNCKNIKALITGPLNTPYEYGCFIFDILIENDYPNSSPKVIYKNTLENSINPNILNDGKVCLSLLGTSLEHNNNMWNKDRSTLLHILLCIQSYIFVEKPFFTAPGTKNLKNKEKGNDLSNKYNLDVNYQTFKYAILEQLINPEEEFKDVIKNHFKLIKNDLILKIQKHTQLNNLSLNLINKLNTL